MGQVLIGISSWSDRTLIESGFYPEEVKTPTDRLQYYGKNFPIAEIDASYHYFATRRNLDLWLENTPAGFTFDIKAFSLFTQHPTPFGSLPRAIRDKFGHLIKHKGNLYLHHLPAEAIDELWQGFARSVQTINSTGKLGAVLFQFPPWFHPHEENFNYVAHCRERLSQYQLALEFRVGSWLSEENRENTLSFLREHGLTLVCVDEPQGFRSSVPPVAEVTTSLGFIRFHGRNGENWERKDVSADERFRYLYDEKDLNEWIPKIRDMADKAAKLHVIFKNKYRDFPVRSARQLGQMLGDRSSASGI
jgi:uncharacterized protein YecE (DUF72 family)